MNLNVNGKILDLDQPKVMAIINITDDSFYSGSRITDPDKILEKVSSFIESGADIVDLGAVSSRPYADEVSEQDEIDRLIPVLDLIKSEYPDIIVSVDTFRSSVAQLCIDHKADMINDITAGSDKNMFSILSNHPNVPYIMMHMQGTPQTMQIAPSYDNIILQILNFFKKKISEAKTAGVKQLIIDPGIGFGKTIEHNFSIVKNLNSFSLFDLPILLGISRKSMIYKHLNITPEKALNGTTAIHMLGLLNGAKILRVHDVTEAIECIKLFELYKQVK